MAPKGCTFLLPRGCCQIERKISSCNTDGDFNFIQTVCMYICMCTYIFLLNDRLKCISTN